MMSAAAFSLSLSCQPFPKQRQEVRGTANVIRIDLARGNHPPLLPFALTASAEKSTTAEEEKRATDSSRCRRRLPFFPFFSHSGGFVPSFFVPHEYSSTRHDADKDGAGRQARRRRSFLPYHFLPTIAKGVLEEGVGIISAPLPPNPIPSIEDGRKLHLRNKESK